MDKLRNLAEKIEQREILRHKIYTVCYQYLNPKSDKELLYDMIPYLEYYECDDPKPINVKIFADDFIALFETYHNQWEKFKALPQQEQDVYYTKIYNVVKNYISIENAVASPKLLISKSGYDGHQAKRMIKTVSFIMGINKELCDAFEPYFNFSTVWNSIFLGMFFIGLSFLCFYAGTILSIIFGIIFLLFGFVHLLNHSTVSNPLTTKEFADKIIGLRLMQSSQDTQQTIRTES